MKSNLPVKIRPLVEHDINFIFNSWLRSYRQSTFAKKIPNSIFYSEHHKIIENLIKNSKIYVACNRNDTKQVIGYISTEYIDNFLIVHYAYIKQSFREMGILNLLLSHINHDKNNVIVHTHTTKAAEKLTEKLNLVYHPYILFNKKGDKNDNSKEK